MTETKSYKIDIKKIFFNIKLIFYVPKKTLIIKDTEKSDLYSREKRIMPISYIHKGNYMRSKEWHTMQKIWLNEKGYRCQMFPFLVLGQHKPKGTWWNNSFYGKYAIHHTSRKAYENLGMEKLNTDVIVLSNFAHKWIYHYLLSFGNKKAGNQKLLKFPNPLQVLMNYWCFLNNWIKLLIILAFFIFIKL